MCWARCMCNVHIRIFVLRMNVSTIYIQNYILNAQARNSQAHIARIQKPARTQLEERKNEKLKKKISRKKCT